MLRRGKKPEPPQRGLDGFIDKQGKFQITPPPRQSSEPSKKLPRLYTRGDELYKPPYRTHQPEEKQKDYQNS